MVVAIMIMMAAGEETDDGEDRDDDATGCSASANNDAANATNQARILACGARCDET